MPDFINYKFSSFQSNLKEISKELDKNEYQRRRKAAIYARKVMRKNVGKKGKSSPGDFPARQSGYNRRSIGYFVYKKFKKQAAIGSKNPGVHLLEFGHGDGKEKNKRPFVLRSLKEAEAGIIKIMSEPYFV